MGPELLSTEWDQVWGTLTTILERRSVQAGYVVSAVVLVAVLLLWARRAGWSSGRTVVGVLAALSLALFPALTLARRGLDLRRRPTCDLTWSVGAGNAEQLLNLVLLVPAGFFAAWALQRFWVVVVTAVALSVGAETLQAALDIGACQGGDVARNVAGAVVGAALGFLAARLNPAGRDLRGSG